MVEWSIEAFRGAAPVGPIVIACPPGHAPAAAGEGPAEPGAAGVGGGKVEPAAAVEQAGEVRQGGAVEKGGAVERGGEDLVLVEGGATRAESVANALQQVETELVAIHDAARPLVDAALIEAVVETLLADPAADAAIAATPVTDTIKVAVQLDPGEDVQLDPDEEVEQAERNRVARCGPYSHQKAPLVESTLDRRSLWGAQTPQVFRTEALRRALESDTGGIATATDEAMLVEAAGGRVLIHPASPQNLKVTTPLDLRVAELLLAESASGRPSDG